MSTFQYKSGLGNSASYQVSSIPYIVRSSTTNNDVKEINFTNVTNFIQISASGDLKVGFSSLGVNPGDNYFITPAGLSKIYDWRVTSLFFKRLATGGGGGGPPPNIDFAIIAGVTTVDSAELSNNWSGSAGVG